MRRLKSRTIQLRFICMFGCAMGLDGCVRYIDGVHRTTNLHTLVTELSESGRWRRSDHKHRRARLARHALAQLLRADGGQAAPSTRSPRARTPPTRNA